MLRISDGAAAKLIGDALDLRHRLRLVWAAAHTGQAPAHQARRIAHAAAAAAQERFVRLGRATEHGLKMILARASAGDAICFKAVIDRIADILAGEGDTESVDVRRSKALGILAQPAQALQLLCHHQDDDWDGPAEPDSVEQEPHGERPMSNPLSAAENTHQSLKLIPPPFDRRRLRDPGQPA